MAMWPGPEGRPANSSALQSSEVRDRLDALYWMDLKPGRVESEATPSMRVYVHPSYGRAVRIDSPLPLFWAGGYTGTLTAPSTNPRYDLVYLVPSGTGTVGVVTGVESASPVIPPIPDETIPLAILYMRVGMTSIKNVDDSVHGYIFYRIQPFLNMGGSVSVKLKSGVNQTVSATATETIITALTKTISGGMLGTDNWIDLTAEITDLDISDSVILVLRLKIDGTTVASITFDTGGTALVNGYGIVRARIRNDGATNVQKGWMEFSGSILSEAALQSQHLALVSGAINMAIDKDVSFTVDYSSNHAGNSITVSGQTIVKFS